LICTSLRIHLIFPQLHCMRVFNFALGRSNNTNAHHIRHCLGYIRAMSLCAADLTLEPGELTDEGFSGEDATHVCTDWSKVYDLMEEHVRD
jgi:hypothetical protein